MSIENLKRSAGREGSGDSGQGAEADGNGLPRTTGFIPMLRTISLQRGFRPWRKASGREDSVPDADPPPSGDEAPAVAAGPETGGMMEFGGYEWKVLDVQGAKALLLSKDIIELRRYHRKNRTVTWGDCDLRKYLNGEFYELFCDEDRGRIVETQVANTGNQWFGTNGGADTTDRVFLLSLEEVVRYFGDSGKLLGERSDEDWIIDEYNDKRIACGNIRGKWRSWFWWLRSPGCRGTYAALVHTDGNVYVDGNIVDYNNGGVRPALWLNIES